MRSLSVLLIFLASSSCNNEATSSWNNDHVQKDGLMAATSIKEVSTTRQDGLMQVSAAEVAVDFMNDYVHLCNQRVSEIESARWIEDHPLLSKDFKKGYKDLLEKARKDDPELGLGYDPIFDAQDWPDNGFQLLKQRSSEYMTLQGKGKPDFSVTVKVKLEGNQWLVDGAGEINIPKAKRAAR